MRCGASWVFVLASTPMFVVSASAAAARHHSVQASLEVALQAVRDDTLVPLAHTGPRLIVAPRYYGQYGFGVLLADARFGAGGVFDRNGAAGLTAHWSLHASTLFVLHEHADGGLHLGPALGWENDTFYLEDWDDAHAYWIGTRWLGPRVHHWHSLGSRWRADLDGQLALLGWVSRPPGYRQHKQETSEDVSQPLLWPTREPHFAWLADFQVLRAALDFHRNFEQRTDARDPVPSGLGFGVETAFIRAAEPAPAFSFEASFRLSYGWAL